jgi:pimeloyl-ACP methyl ester carboxylesterase
LFNKSLWFILADMLHFNTYLNNKDKPWVTFVHGAGGSSSIWFKQIRDFKLHFNVLLLDLRGHGNSKPKLKDSFNTDYTFDSITYDIIEVLEILWKTILNAWTKLYLVGQS